MDASVAALLASRTSHGVRELKLHNQQEKVQCICRTSHGVRELKFVSSEDIEINHKVAPHTGCVS